MKRRDFLKISAATVGTGALLASNAKESLARENEPRKPEALGLLYDSTLCIGCKACVSKCKEVNKNPPEFQSSDELWDHPIDLSAKTMNIIKQYRTGKALHKDSKDVEDSYTFIKRQCMHCVDPSCVSACPASAMVKDSSSGIVRWVAENCIGCRYCMVACPYNIPKFEWDKALPRIRKCELCRQREEGKYSGCAEACPTGATLYGKTSDLMEEAKRRLQLKPGSLYQYPTGKLERQKDGSLIASSHHEKVVPEYYPSFFGEKDGGGTQCLILTPAGVPPQKLGLPDLPERSYASMTEGVQHLLYKGMIAPGVLLLALGAAAYRTTKNEKGDDHES